ncbi:uncharacterized protein LOC141629093 [Silene latifolia]|uniref:uncharacterized protein LOC141629093 n=1 Tax=Silene latifolia TaxID=37657 RepID=UPI003D7882FA
MLVGKIWASKAINGRAAVDTMLRLWNSKGKVMGSMVDVKEKLFVFKFEDERDKIKVMEGQPWHFDKFLPLWECIYDLPIKGRTNEGNLRKLGAQVGKFIVRDEVRVSELERMVRIRILHDIRKALKPTVEVRIPSGKVDTFVVKYERLPLFCYGCGVLGHGEKDCESGPYDEDDLQFGEGLRDEQAMIEKLQKFTLSSTARKKYGTGDMVVSSVLENVEGGGVGGGQLGQKGSRLNSGEQEQGLVVKLPRSVRGEVMDAINVVVGDTGAKFMGKGGDRSVSREMGVVVQGAVERKKSWGRGWTRVEREADAGSNATSLFCENSLINDFNKRGRDEDDQLLRLLAGEGDGPWLCMGDFNEVLYSTEMKGGSRAQWQMNNFRNVVDEAGIRDIPLEGYEFTFDNGQAWFDLFPYARLFHLSREWSDHCPIKVVGDSRAGQDGRGAKVSWFEHIWVGEDGCEEEIRRGWDSGNGELTESLARCAKELIAWKGVSIGKILKCLAKKRERLKVLNEGDRSAGRVRERKQVVTEIASLLQQEERFWRQRSRAIWLRDGDRNSNFFHRVGNGRKQKNFISKVCDEQGRVFEATEAVSRCALAYFRALFESESPVGFDDILEVVGGRVTEEMNERLAADYTGEEVVFALNQMHQLKAQAFSIRPIGTLLVLRWSGMLRRAAEMGSIHGIKIAEHAPSVSHLFFADNSIIFVKAKEVKAREVLRILDRYQQPSGQMLVQDVWYWSGERDGVYSVRSAYRLMVKQDGDLEGSPSDLTDSWLWNTIWRASVLPRIKVFFSQLCNEAIATRGNISSRMSSTGNECLQCGDCVESCLHVVHERGWAGGVWDVLELDMSSCSGFAKVKDWAEVALREMGLQEQVGS